MSPPHGTTAITSTTVNVLYVLQFQYRRDPISTNTPPGVQFPRLKGYTQPKTTLPLRHPHATRSPLKKAEAIASRSPRASILKLLALTAVAKLAC